MAHYTSFEDLEIYQLSREICQEVWGLITNTPLGRDFKLRDQINGSSGSVMDNIAEGFGRGGNKEFINFLGIARGSCFETKSQLQRGLDRAHYSYETFDSVNKKIKDLIDQISKFINYLKSSGRKGSKFD